MTADALPAGAPTPTDETLSTDERIMLLDLARGCRTTLDEMLAIAKAVRLLDKYSGLRSRQTRDEDGQRCGVETGFGPCEDFYGHDGYHVVRMRLKPPVARYRLIVGDDNSASPSTPQNEGSSQ